jgi:hypothetical protein
MEPRRRSEVASWVAKSPSLLAAVAEQQRAIAAVRGAHVPAPDDLRERVRELRADSEPRRRRAQSMIVGALAAAGLLLAAILALALPGEIAPGPTAVQAADLTLLPASGPPPSRSRVQPQLLDAAVGPVAFPYWDDRFGWQATGMRGDRLGDRTVTTVFYESGARRVGYSIVAGPPLAPPVATTDRIVPGVRLRSFLANGRPVVMFTRRGLSCVVSGRYVDVETLFTMSAWRGDGQVRF